jgi:ABC-type branched-subunit amino acid transport system substrate-binding protein
MPAKKWGGVLLAVAALLVYGAGVLWAQNPDSNQDSIRIGINVPLSGPYKNQGQDEKRAYQLAMEQINDEGGLLGRRIVAVIKDTQVDPQVAADNALALIRENKVDMITGGSSSAVAIAQSDVCQQNGVVFMAGLTHSSATTGFDKTTTGYKEQKAHRHTFRWYLNDWMTKKALVPFLVEQFGQEATYFHITADYIWGDTIENAIQSGTGLYGAKTLDTTATPLGTEDFSQELQQARNSGADILVLNLFGQDLVRALNQVQQMGLTDSFKIVAPLIELNMAHAIDNEVLQKTYSTTNWYHGLSDRFQGSQAFVQAFSREYDRPPGAAAATAWVAIKEWAAAVERAGTTASNQVIRELEGHSFTLLKDTEKWRSWDHQAIGSVLIVQGKSPQNMANEWDVLKIIDSVPSQKVMRTRTQNPVMLELLQ